MELNGFQQAPVNDDEYEIPYHPYKAYSLVLTSALEDKDDIIQRAIQYQLPYVKRQMYYIHENPPPGRIRYFL